MKLLLNQICLALAFLALVACNSKSEAPPSPTSNGSVPASASTALKPQAAEAPAASAGTGPAQGGTAIGGITQASTGARSASADTALKPATPPAVPPAK